MSQSINWSYWGEDPSKRLLLVIPFFFVLISYLLPLELDEENLTSGAKQKWKPSASKQYNVEKHTSSLIIRRAVKAIVV